MSYQRTLEERLKFLNCDEETHRHLDEFREILAPDMEAALDYFYEKISSVPELGQLFANKEAMEAARKSQKHHWLNVLFSRDFGTAHEENTSRIGAAHERAGLTIGWYMNSYCLMLNRFVRLAADHYHNDAKKVTRMIQEINKTVFLDMNYVIDSYLNSKDEALKRILSRAESFVSEIKDIDTSLGQHARSLHAHLDTVNSRLGSSHEPAFEVRHDIEKATQEAAELAARIEALKQDLERMQKQHRLQYLPARKVGFLERLKGLFK